MLEAVGCAWILHQEMKVIKTFSVCPGRRKEEEEEEALTGN